MSILEKKDDVMISVIIPVYNAEEYLEQCVVSVLSQTFFDFEVLLVNDGSTDSSGFLCDKFADGDSRVKAFHKPNGGQNSAIKYALKHANGETICFVDSDDWVEPDMLEKLYSYMKKHPCDCVVANCYRNAKEQTELLLHNFKEGFYDKEQLREKIFPHLFVRTKAHVPIAPSRCAKLFSKEKLFNILKYCEEDVKYGEDKLLVYPYMMISEGVFFINDKLYHYRENTNSISYRFDQNRINEQKKVILRLRNAASELTDFNFKNQFEAMTTEAVSIALSNMFKFRDLLSKSDLKALFKKVVSDAAVSKTEHPYARTMSERVKYFLINHKCANTLWAYYSIKQKTY